MFQQIQTVRRAWFTWVEEKRETLLHVGQAVHEVAAKVGTLRVEVAEGPRTQPKLALSAGSERVLPEHHQKRFISAMQKRA
jgi:hypothetical protein